MNMTAQPANIPILIVDDRPENLLSLEMLLADQGYELVKATSGNEALRQILKQDFALVLMDVQMPEMDGFETAELMRSNPKTRHIPIIFVTAGMKDLQFQFKGYDSGAVDYLAKPIEPLFLQSKVRVFSELFSQRRELEQHKVNLEKLVYQRTEELRQSSEALKTSNTQLLDRNRELQAIELLLRRQITEFVETHDQLLATEEMLRVQINEYEATQKLLNESNRNLQTLFDVSPLAIVVSSFPGGIIREINHTFYHDFGYLNDYVIGKTGDELGLWVNPEERRTFLQIMQVQQVVSGFAAEIKTISGEPRNVLLYSNLITFKDETCLLIVFLDVTGQKRMEEQIRQQQKMEVIGQLAGGVAHDFNNMLTAIMGSAELLAINVKNDALMIKQLNNIQQAATRSASLTGQLLAFSRKGQKKNEPVSINTTINDAIALLERTIDKKIILESRLIAQKALISGDPALLQNALLNLGINARDAMPDGGVIKYATSNIELDDKFCKACAFDIQPGFYIEISVADTGSGMTKEVLQHAFEPFFTTKGIGKGTGLGLAAVYGTVTEHRGCITVHSEPGIGTVFKMFLPLSGETQLQVKACEETTQGSGGILLVDDEELLRDVGKALLEDMGYRVYLAENGKQALDIYDHEKECIDLVILDMLMPVMGGKETLQHLKERNPDIRVLISSGFHHEGTEPELKNRGAIGFLQKPYFRQELCKAVNDALQKN